MAYHRSSYLPAFTSNDTYGNFYDAPKVSLITVPDRLKNYDLDVRKAGSFTTGAEYGDFMRREVGLQQQRYPGYARLQQQQQELQLEQQQQQQRETALPPRLVYGREGEDDLGNESNDEDQLPPPPPPPPQKARPDSVRGLPPPTSLVRYRERPEADPPRQMPTPPPPPPPPQPQYRVPRSRSPPPPPDVGTYRSNLDAYTGHRAPAMKQQQQQHHQQQHLEPQMPPLRLGGREVHLPAIESVEVRMRDKSKMVLDVRDFYRRYLGD